MSKSYNFHHLILQGDNEVGFLHISELGTQRIAKITDVLAEGDTVTVMVVDVDSRGRAKFSIRAMLKDDEDSSRFIKRAKTAQSDSVVVDAVSSLDVNPVAPRPQSRPSVDSASQHTGDTNGDLNSREVITTTKSASTDSSSKGTSTVTDISADRPPSVAAAAAVPALPVNEPNVDHQRPNRLRTVARTVSAAAVSASPENEPIADLQRPSKFRDVARTVSPAQSLSQVTTAVPVASEERSLRPEEDLFRPSMYEFLLPGLAQVLQVKRSHSLTLNSASWLSALGLKVGKTGVIEAIPEQPVRSRHPERARHHSQPHPSSIMKDRRNEHRGADRAASNTSQQRVHGRGSHRERGGADPNSRSPTVSSVSETAPR